LPDLRLWGQVDHFSSLPLRDYRGDTAHYLAILHSAQLNHGPTANAYFWEQASEPSQFYVFQRVVGWLGDLGGLEIVWVAVILRLVVAWLVFCLLSRLLLIFSVPERFAAYLSFAFTLFYGAVAFQGYALGFWFLPCLLGALYLAAQFSIKPFTSFWSIWRPVLAVALASVHPVYFTLVGLAVGLIILFKLIREPKSAVFLGAGVWSVLSLVAFYLLFWPFLASHFPAAQDVLYRIVAIDTRIIIHPLFSLRLIFLCVLSLFAWRQGRDQRWLVVSAFSFAALIGLDSYLLTGTYIANDHYAIIEDSLSVLTAALLLSKAPNLSSRASKIFSLSALALLVFSLIMTVDFYFHFQLGYYGKWFPVHLAYFLIALTLWWPQKARDYLSKFFVSKVAVMVFLVICPVLYANVLLYKNAVPHLAGNQEVQEYRELISYLRTQDEGVVLADPKLSNLISLFTNQRVYWSPIAFSESVTDQELIQRWQEARLFFYQSLSGPEAQGSVVGTINRCSDFGRGEVLDLLTKIGWSEPQATLCQPEQDRIARFAELNLAADRYSHGVSSRGEWQAAYRLDKLVVLPGEVVTPWLLEQDFMLEKEIGGAKVYTYLKH
jgi:hypothetical protein